MHPARISPIVIWVSVFVVSFVVIAGSMAYARSVGDPLIAEEKAKRAEREEQARQAQLQQQQSGRSTTFGTFPGSARVQRNLEYLLPNTSCANDLLILAGDAPLSYPEVESAWQAAVDCMAADSSRTTIDIAQFAPDSKTRQCLTVWASQMTIVIRLGEVPTPSLGSLLDQCVADGNLPDPTAIFGGSSPGDGTDVPADRTPSGAVPPGDGTAPPPPDRFPPPADGAPATTVASIPSLAPPPTRAAGDAP